jgi:fructose-specific phosphotransferase system component IIB
VLGSSESIESSGIALLEVAKKTAPGESGSAEEPVSTGKSGVVTIASVLAEMSVAWARAKGVIVANSAIVRMTERFTGKPCREIIERAVVKRYTSWTSRFVNAARAN